MIPIPNSSKQIHGKTTGIGSLPHHNIDAALAYSFKHEIPFLPQIPLRNPWEYMIPQALEKLPGLELGPNGEVWVNMEIWSARTAQLTQVLDRFFDQPAEWVTHFEPSAATSSSWQAFLWELQERGCKTAKVQIAGPITAQWSLRLKNGESLDKHPDLSGQVFKLILARAMAMTHRLGGAGVTPVLYLDEPGLYAFSSKNPGQIAVFQELKLLIQALKKAGNLIGLHCCSNTDWKTILTLELDYLSLDTHLSLLSLLRESKVDLIQFLERGGRLSLGIIPTARTTEDRSSDPGEAYQELRSHLSAALGNESLTQKVLQEALFTPACGLALHSVPESETILDSLNDFVRHVRKLG